MKTPKHGSVLLCCLMAAILALCNGCRRPENRQGSSSIQIKGSDTMVNLTQTWAEEFTKNYPSIEIAVTGGGSGTGIASFISKTCQIVQSSRPMDEKEISAARANGLDPTQLTVAMDGIAVIVNPSNPVSRLTLEQVRDIFMGNKKNWREVGGNDAEIIILSREVNSGTHVFFKEHVLRRGKPKSKEEFAKGALLMASSQAIADETAQNPDAIGYYGIGYISSSQKAIAIAKDVKSVYYEPKNENIIKGLYPISRMLYLYTDGQPAGDIKTFIDFVMSPAGQKIVVDLFFVPIR